MSSPWAVAVFVAATALSLGASAVLVVRLERVGARLGLSEALLGLVAALAADTPEVTSAVTALAHGQHDIGTGVVLGSNVFNLAALIGLGAVVAGGIKLHRRVVIFEGVVALWIAALAIAAVTGLITPVAALVLALVVLAPYAYVSAVHPPAAPPCRSRSGCDPGSPGPWPRKNRNCPTPSTPARAARETPPSPSSRSPWWWRPARPWSAAPLRSVPAGRCPA
jgi:hypothetical protein